MIVLGILGLFAGLGMDTSVSGGVGSTGRIVNIGLLGQQTSVLTVSGFLFMTGCMLIGFATVRDAVEALGAVIGAQAPRPIEQALYHTPQSSSEASDNFIPGMRTCPKCYAVAKEEATSCWRCRHAFEGMHHEVAQ
ncbi:hypothetical protein [Azospirillum canadense]|uniref:hypothetical protein n=1 Tax=Azospirillum canadense TaxID=403962 RepID=UPI0022274276|nr:hypothetical protein [Azospirillum canadense]MCW2242906.1 hypothetical protein [Azospirillum canadense]